jgi:hypothetical protein
MMIGDAMTPLTPPFDPEFDVTVFDVPVFDVTHLYPCSDVYNASIIVKKLQLLKLLNQSLIRQY